VPTTLCRSRRSRPQAKRERASRETLDEPHHLSRTLDRRDAVKPGNDREPPSLTLERFQAVRYT